MEILIKSVEIVDKPTALHKKRRNVLIKNGVIQEVSTGNRNLKAPKIIDGSQLKLSLGWFDMRAHFCDPGFESREDVHSGRKAATAGGFTDVLLQPNTNPVVETKNEVSYLHSGNQRNLTQIHVTGSVTSGNQGKELTEMLDLHQAGALAFSDGYEPLWHTNVFGKALQYLEKQEGLLINRPDDRMLSARGQMNEGVNSTMLGMPGIPKLSEELMVARDLALLEYNGGRLHFANISSEVSLNLIRAAKKKGLSVSCDVAVYQLLYHDGLLDDYDTNYKVNPPLRDPKTNRFLKKALAEGLIDVMVSDHHPQDEEGKKLEFDLASFGMISLQEMPSMITTLAEDIDLGILLERITYAPRKLLGLPIPKIAKGEPAVLTLFDPQQEWTLDDGTNVSKSRNSPNFGRELKGKAVAVFNNGKVHLDKSLSVK